MKVKKEKRFKKCPRCGFKTYNSFVVCGKCELNFDKFKTATNIEAKEALRKGEKERVVYTTQFPSDVNKWELFFLSLFLGWTGVHLWKVGRLSRAICHSIGLALFAVYAIISLYDVNNLLWNVGNIFGAFGAVTYILSVVDIFEIAFNRFKVPVSLPYKEEK